ncbi:MAG TPA: nuclear transport factor 2 family protein [Prolixibacteraceae bacterium]|nr:nuclear transport factor 2 family protein [Prolixibacteraceae bacterium]
MTQKEIAQHFLMLCAKGQSQEAFDLYAGKDFKHHNSYFRGDAQTLIRAMEEEAKRNPTKIFDVHRALEDEDLVAVHSHIRQDANDLGVAVIHIFRFSEGRIAELWDVGQAVPADIINENGML